MDADFILEKPSRYFSGSGTEGEIEGYTASDCKGMWKWHQYKGGKEQRLGQELAYRMDLHCDCAIIAGYADCGGFCDGATGDDCIAKDTIICEYIARTVAID